MDLRWRLKYLKARIPVLQEQLIMWIVWHLPRKLIYFAVIRCWAHGTTGQYGMTSPDDLGWGEALDRWEGKAKAA
ncbi:MAG TPA: hypothetical protein PKD09_09470 [Aggregatilinea sp.]|uniref:hypothetical protein n=1 Tax=Aggregatilinea sp. TaxID=2806333 RepID=UPI002BF9465E|nr:hypothetical protein [Aggregatilinea sp.]HML21866.1 hypothetical protein [Aggregatilinea sp.]